MSAILSVQELVKTYPGTRKSPPVEAVRGISFEVAQGEFFGLLGPNGAGKSTTLGCITTLVRPTSGRIVVDGVDVARDAMEAKGETWPVEEEEEFKAPIRERYEAEGNPYYATARLWDDGVIDPAQTRDVLGLAISASLNAPVPKTPFGVFRM